MMQPILSNDAMRAADSRGIDEYGIPSLALMESAGRAIADEAHHLLTGSLETTLVGKRVFILCGIGNNGGDGFVAARHLLNRGAEVWLRLVGTREKLRGDAMTMLVPLESLRAAKGLRGKGIVDELHEAEIDTLSYIRFDLAIDAIFGTGFSGDVRGEALKAIDLLKRLRREQVPVLAVDIPSGVSGDTGAAETCAGADVTVTFAAAKLGHWLEPGHTLAGKIIVHDIGLPDEILQPGAVARLPSYIDVKYAQPPLAANANKGTRGKLFVLAGSIGLTGAASLTANAAVRAGAGLVVTGTPETAEATVAGKLVEAMTVALPDHDGKLSELAVNALPGWADWSDAWAIGPGLGRSEAVTTVVRMVWENVRKPMVVDADALYSLAEILHRERRLPVAAGLRILTPHHGEFARLVDQPVAAIAANPLHYAREFAQRHDVILVLKGAPTVIGAPDGTLYINPTGNAALATGGTGDVLTGIIGALLARHYAVGTNDALSAAWSAAWLHGRVADRWIQSGNQAATFHASLLLSGLADVYAELDKH